MIALDLKSTIFVLLLVILIPVAGCAFLWWRRTRRFSNAVSWQVLEALPFGIAIHKPDDSLLFINRTANHLLRQIDRDPYVALQRFKTSAGDSSAPRNGMLHQPVFLKWWHYSLDGKAWLLVLVDGGDQQRYVRQQAFIGQLVHELRSPLTALVAHSEVVASSQTSEAVRQASIQTIQNSAHRLGRLVRDMLELNRLETADDLPLQPTNLLLVAEDAIAQLILRAEACGVNLNFEADMYLPLVLAHPDRLKQVFLNLLDNAIKFCREGDEIWVRLKNQPDGVICSVSDSGPGIAPNDLPHVTECFYRARNDLAIEGNGIGLALVCEILKHHNSQLLIESATTSPTGTTCQWQLECVPQESPATRMLEKLER